MIGHPALGSAQFQAWRTVLMADPCVYCGGTSTGMDHIEPRAAGGSNGWESSSRKPSTVTCGSSCCQRRPRDVQNAQARRLQPCSEPGCPTLVTSGRCSACAATADQRRPSSSERGYDWKWTGYSKRWRQRYPVCGMRVDMQLYAQHSRCVQAGIVTPVAVVDHIVPVERGGAFWDKHNHQSLCASCHGAKDGERRFGR